MITLKTCNEQIQDNISLARVVLYLHVCLNLLVLLITLVLEIFKISKQFILPTRESLYLSHLLHNLDSLYQFPLSVLWGIYIFWEFQITFNFPLDI